MSKIITNQISPQSGNSVTINGDVSIGGTLTYEDVTNIDVVGVITARSGVRIGATGANTLIAGNATGIGIGTNNPSTGKLCVGNTGESSTVLAITASTSGTSLLSFNDTNSGQGGLRYAHSTDHMQFHTADSEQMRLDSSGRLLIGKNSSEASIPGQAIAKLQLAGGTDGGLSVSSFAANAFASNLEFRKSRSGTVGTNTIVQSGDTLGKLYYNGADGTNYIIAAGIEAAVDGTPGTNDMPGRLMFFTTADGASSPTERIRIDSSGNVNFPGTDPIITTGFNMYLRTPNNIEINGDSDSSGSGYIDFRIGSSSKARIDNSGRLLVGTTTEGHADADELTLESSSGYTGITLRSSTTAGGAIYFSDATSGAAQYDGQIVYSQNGRSMTFGTAQTTRMTINNIGSTTITCDATATGLTIAHAGGSGESRRLFQGNYSSSTESYRVWTNGDVENANNSYGALSDAKLKENIVDASSQWDDIKNIRVRNYNFIEGQTHTQIGVVAQEVETVSPGIVSDRVDVDEEGNNLGTTTKAVNYSVLYMKAIKGLQEAMTRIETLETKVAALESS